jgi:hypothetical protein
MWEDKAQQRHLKQAGWAMALLLLALCLFGTAGAQESTETGYSVDAVIVMDQSDSMNGSEANVKNDPDNNRLDAAEMFIAMCDMNGSRIAFIPFAGTVQNYGDNDLVDISDRNVRADKIAQIDALRNRSTAADTDLGEALSKAVNMLLTRTDTKNKPMIVVLTDGNNSLTNIHKYAYKSAYVWDVAANSFVYTKFSGDYDTDMADTLMESAVDVAEDNGIPIYTIALLDKSSSGYEPALVNMLENRLAGFANRTNATSVAIDSTNANTLPEIFGEIFATQIGSSLVLDLSPVAVEGQPGRYKVVLPVLNESVMEANIYVPMTGVTETWLYDPNDVNCTGGSKDVIVMNSTKFNFYKIKQPRTLGNWKLEFQLEDTTQSVKDITFSLLYNYQINLQTQLGKSIADMQAAGDTLTLGKSDTLYISSQFYTPDGNPSTDTNLYSERTGDAWETIRATWELYTENGTVPLTHGTLNNDSSAFTGQIDLHNLITDGAGYNTLSSGEYKLLIKAEGAGLSRTNWLALTLTNKAPIIRDTSAQDQMLRYLEVDNPEKPETLQTQQITINLLDLVADPDNDRIRFQLTPVGDAETILPLTVDADTGIAQGMTIKDSATGMFRYGDAAYTLTVLDDDTAQQPTSFTLTIKVVSTASQIIGRFQSVTTCQGIDGDSGKAGKNSPVVFSMRLNNTQTGAPDTTGEIRNYTGQAVVCDAANTSTMLASLDMELNENGTERTATYITPNTSGDFVVYFTYVYTGYATSEVNDSLTFQVLNTPPTVVQATLDALPQTMLFDPGIFVGLEQPTPADALTLRLDKLFTDLDNEKGLVYGDPVFTADEDDAGERMGFTRSGNTVQFVALGAGKVQLSLSATDGDGKTVTATRTLSVVSIRTRWTMYFIIFIILLIIIVIIIILLYQHFKPYFPVGVAVSVKSRASVISMGEYTLPHTKKQVSLFSVLLSAPFATDSALQDCLGHITIKPNRDSNGSVHLYYDQSVPACVVKQNELKLPAKGTTWHMDEEIIISINTGELWRFALVRDPSYADMGTPFGVDNISEDGFGSGTEASSDKPSSFNSFSSFSDNDNNSTF